MVRLKGGSEWDYDILEEISIPYGAIKSIHCKHFFPVVVLFQFLMVRLKAPADQVSLYQLTDFNSLWCD